MANSDMKTIKELATFTKAIEGDEVFPIVAKDNGVDKTMNIKLGSLFSQVRGIEYTGILTAGSTSITFSSTTQVTYDQQRPYSVGELCVNEGIVYICVVDCTAAAWDTNKINFIECPSISTDSTVDIYTSVFGVNPTDVTLDTNSITLAFDEQDSDIRVKVRIS